MASCNGQLAHTCALGICTSRIARVVIYVARRRSHTHPKVSMQVSWGKIFLLLAVE